MGALLLLPATLSIPSLSKFHQNPPRLALSDPFFPTKSGSNKPGFAHISYSGITLLHESIIVPRSAQNDANEFLDEDGVVDDMDGYLNYLSLEYDSVWDTKPAWCQPWTIFLTGVTAIASSWIFVQSVLVTMVVLCLIFAWWYIFLYSYPKAYSDMIADRRKKVTSGIEDTFGLTKNQ